MAAVKDVARLAGVSRAMVSGVLRKRASASPAPCMSVERAIRSLRYQPNVTPCVLRTRRIRTLALLVSDIRNPLHTAVVRRVQDMASGHGYTAIVAFAFSWNEFIYALTLTFERATTIPLLIAGAKMSQGIQFWFVSVRVLLALLPPVLLALGVQRYLVRGLTLGAVR